MLFLDRHHVWCAEGTALTEFKLHRPTMSQLQYKYSCTSTPVGSYKTVTKHSPYDSEGAGDSRFLDRHAVDCGSDGMINMFWLQRSSPYGRIRYDYKCNIFHLPPLDCYWQTTQFDSDGTGNAIFLDRHHLKCNSDTGYALSYFRLQRSADQKNVQYQYRCCRKQ